MGHREKTNHAVSHGVVAGGGQWGNPLLTKFYAAGKFSSRRKIFVRKYSIRGWTSPTLGNCSGKNELLSNHSLLRRNFAAVCRKMVIYWPNFRNTRRCSTKQQKLANRSSFTTSKTQTALASICCGFAVLQLVVQQIHNKWKQVEFGPKPTSVLHDQWQNMMEQAARRNGVE